MIGFFFLMLTSEQRLRSKKPFSMQSKMQDLSAPASIAVGK
jgi:hypothetical protein